MSRAEEAARSILDRIADGQLLEGAELPSESELAAELGMSRLTIREAVKNLAARGVLSVQHGKRNRVAPVEDWDLLNVDLMSLRGRMRGEKRGLVEQLTEVRRIIEIGAADLASDRIDAGQLERMQQHLDQMRAAEEGPDVEAAVEADILFHRVIIEAAGNEFLAAVYRPMEEVLRAVRLETSATARVRGQAMLWHAEILGQLAAGSREGSREAMRGHMEQTVRAIREEQE